MLIALNVVGEDAEKGLVNIYRYNNFQEKEKSGIPPYTKITQFEQKEVIFEWLKDLFGGTPPQSLGTDHFITLLVAELEKYILYLAAQRSIFYCSIPNRNRSR